MDHDSRSPVERFRFRFTPLFRAAAAPFGVRPGSCEVRVSNSHLEAHFGPWTVRTPLENVKAAQVTGGYAIPKVIGPAHLSFSDRGLTFASNPYEGVCIEFVDPVPGIDPVGAIRHPGLTVTVEDVAGLVDRLNRAR